MFFARAGLSVNPHEQLFLPKVIFGTAMGIKGIEITRLWSTWGASGSAQATLNQADCGF